jgi:hypothetical protein
MLSKIQPSFEKVVILYHPARFTIFFVVWLINPAVSSDPSIHAGPSVGKMDSQTMLAPVDIPPSITFSRCFFHSISSCKLLFDRLVKRLITELI